jgi:hypothetical protein
MRFTGLILTGTSLAAFAAVCGHAISPVPGYLLAHAQASAGRAGEHHGGIEGRAPADEPDHLHEGGRTAGINRSASRLTLPMPKSPKVFANRQPSRLRKGPANNREMQSGRSAPAQPGRVRAQRSDFLHSARTTASTRPPVPTLNSIVRRNLNPAVVGSIGLPRINAAAIDGRRIKHKP